MTTDYAGASTFWSTIKRLSSIDFVTAIQLYDLCILKLADRTAWLRDAITGLRSDLASASLNTKARLVCSVDLSTLTYDPTTGSLNGKTLQIISDTSSTITVTFGTGGGAPANAGDVVSQILVASAGNPGALLDSSNHLNLLGGFGIAGTVSVSGGNAGAILGTYTGAYATGSTGGGDGISAVSGAAIAGAITLAAGSLRSMLTTLANNVLPVASGSTTGVWRVVQSPLFDAFTGAGYAPGQAVPVLSAGVQTLAVANGSTITQLRTLVDPQNTVMPGANCKISLTVISALDGTTVLPVTFVGGLTTSTDTNSTTGTYLPAHTFTSTLLTPLTIDNSQYIYQIIFNPDTGSTPAPVKWWGTSVFIKNTTLEPTGC